MRLGGVRDIALRLTRTSSSLARPPPSSVPRAAPPTAPLAGAALCCPSSWCGARRWVLPLRHRSTAQQPRGDTKGKMCFYFPYTPILCITRQPAYNPHRMSRRGSSMTRRFPPPWPCAWLAGQGGSCAVRMPLRPPGTAAPPPKLLYVRVLFHQVWSPRIQKLPTNPRYSAQS
jgi:hypothetical protein